MKFEFAAVVVATLILGPAMATAQQFSGQVGLDFTSIDDGAEQSSTDLNGAIETAMGPVGVQLDFSSRQYDDGTDISSVGLHVFYDISPSTAVGLVYYREDWAGSIYATYGIEAVHLNGPWEFQGFAVREESIDGGSYEADLSGVSARYKLSPSIMVGGGFVSVSGDDEGTRVELEGAYVFGNGMSASLVAGREDYSGGPMVNTIGLGLTYEFGGGVTFDRRDFIALLPGY